MVDGKNIFPQFSKHMLYLYVYKSCYIIDILMKGFKDFPL